MIRIDKEEVKKIEKVFPNIRDMKTDKGEPLLKRTTKGSKWYLIEERQYEWYAKKKKYYFEMFELIGGELIRIDGLGNPIPLRDIAYFDKCIRRNKK